MRRVHLAWIVAAGALAWPGVVEAGGRVDIAVTSVDTEQTPGGARITVEGEAADVPDGTKVRASLSLDGGDKSKRAFGEVTGGTFIVVLGPFEGRLLPGSYEVEAEIDPRLQHPRVAEGLRDMQILPGREGFERGTREEAEAERTKLRDKYEMYLETLQGVYGSLGMWGSALVAKSAGMRVQHRGDPPSSAVNKVLSEWEKFTEGTMESNLPTVRFDLRQLHDYVVLGYFPRADDLLTEIITTLDRWHASYTLAIHENLGEEPPKEIAAKGGFSISDLKGKLPRLARQTYEAIGAEPSSWQLIEAGTPERIEDAHGNVFRSTVAKFEVHKPGEDWFFDVSPVNPTLRLRIRMKDEELTDKVVAGIELRDYPQAEGFDDLAKLDEIQTRRRWPGFELISIEDIAADDPTMPQGVRPGQETRYWIEVGDRTFFILQYALFCRWHKRTYNLMCWAEKGVEEDWTEVFETMCESFKVLDAPELQEKARESEGEETGGPAEGPGGAKEGERAGGRAEEGAGPSEEDGD